MGEVCPEVEVPKLSDMGKGRNETLVRQLQEAEAKPDVRELLTDAWNNYHRGRGKISPVIMSVSARIYDEFVASCETITRFSDSCEAVSKDMRFKSASLIVDDNARHPFQIIVKEVNGKDASPKAGKE